MLATIYTLSSGNRALIARRRIKDIHSAGEKSISDAIRLGTASWPIAEELVLHARSAEIPLIGIECSETKDVWLTRTEYFFDRERFNYVASRNDMQRALPLKFFRTRQGKTRL